LWARIANPRYPFTRSIVYIRAIGVCKSALSVYEKYSVYPSDRGQKPKKEKWDLNGDGKLSKSEADFWYQTGKGKTINVDNSLIDWKGLEMPLTGNSGFAVQTGESFFKLPYETASTYGGTSFTRIDSNTAIVNDQDYHYNIRPIGSIGLKQSWSDIGRNILTSIGRPYNIYGGIPYQTSQGMLFKIHYINPILVHDKK
jgi:hypothetical protein